VTGCHHRSRTYAGPEVQRAFAKARLPLERVATGRREITRLLRLNSCALDDADAARQAMGHVETILRAKPKRDSIGGTVVISAYLFDSAADAKRINDVGYFRDGDDGCLYMKSPRVFNESRNEGNLLVIGVSSNNNGATGVAFERLSAALGWH
jgi:hypothetical protein